MTARIDNLTDGCRGSASGTGQILEGGVSDVFQSTVLTVNLLMDLIGMLRSESVTEGLEVCLLDGEVERDIEYVEPTPDDRVGGLVAPACVLTFIVIGFFHYRIELPILMHDCLFKHLPIDEPLHLVRWGRLDGVLHILLDILAHLLRYFLPVHNHTSNV